MTLLDLYRENPKRFKSYMFDIDGTLLSEGDRRLLENTSIYGTLFKDQQKGVISLIKMLRKWNGAILADAVGLGKTFSALAVMKYFQDSGYTILLICPKKLEMNWRQYLHGQASRFDRDEFRYVIRFHTDLQDGRMDKDDAKHVLVNEHNYDSSHLIFHFP